MSVLSAARRLRAFLPLLLASVIASVLFAAPPASAGSQPSSVTSPTGYQQVLGDTVMTIAQRENHAANVAISHIGDPYRYGAAGPSAFDCSGLTMWSYGHSNLSLPRTSAAQYGAVRHILKSNLMRGDLVFFHDSSGHVYHVGIFLYRNADNRAVIIHAPYTGQYVHRAPVWTTSWYAGTRRH